MKKMLKLMLTASVSAAVILHHVPREIFRLPPHRLQRKTLLFR